MVILVAVAGVAILLLGIGLGQLVSNRHSKPTHRQRGRRLLDTVRGFAIYGLDGAGRIDSWNDGAEYLCGYGASEAQGRHGNLLDPPDERQSGSFQAQLAMARAEGRAEGIGWRQRKDGSQFWAHWVITAQRDLRDEGDHGVVAPGFVVVLHDISQRRIQDERIRFQAALLNRVRSAIIATDCHGSVVYMNAFAEDLFDLPWERAQGQDLRTLGLFPDLLDGGPLSGGPLGRQISFGQRGAGSAPTGGGVGGHGRLEREITAHRLDGTSFPALCLTTISPDPSGEGYAEVHLIHDLTETQRMRNALQHTANLALLGRMSASLVHEISQPMNVIRLTAEGCLLKMDRGGVDEETLRVRLRTIADQAARLFDTIDFMQTFSRLDSAVGSEADGVGTLAPMDLARSTREALSVISPAMGQVEILTQGPEEGCWVLGKPRQIEQVLINLLSNAIQAVSAEAGKVEVSLTSLAGKDGWCVVVDDNGPGIPQERRATVFEPFFTTKPAGQGTGLGLAISLGIARAMGGTLDVADSPLGGARLTLWLPAAIPPAQAPVAERPQIEEITLPEDVPACGASHILVVDDEDGARDAMAAFLTDLGYHVSTAPGGDIACQVLAEAAETANAVDLVITDLRMADGDGYALLAHLADDYPQVFTVVVTGQPLRDREALADRGVNADQVLRKPIGLDHLGVTVATLLDGE